jgi:CheY-like chemotaxis protein
MMVLLVDDYPDALEVWDLFLTSAGYRVITALDGQEGLDKARALLPDIAVLDLQLPSLSGAEMAAALRADPRTAHIPLIAATGHARTGLTEARAAGFDALIVKPCDPDDLVREIQRLTPIAAGGSSH